MVYRNRKYVVLCGSELIPLARTAELPRVLFRCFERTADCQRHLASGRCDLLIVDVEEPAAERLDMLRTVGAMYPWLVRVALVGAGSTARAVEAMKVGATECLEKPLSREELLSAVSQGLRRMDSPEPDSLAVLTPTELKIVDMILAGKTSGEMAAALKRSKRTVDAHRSRIVRKLGISSLIELARWAVSRGFYPPSFHNPTQARRTTTEGEDSLHI